MAEMKTDVPLLCQRVSMRKFYRNCKTCVKSGKKKPKPKSAIPRVTRDGPSALGASFEKILKIELRAEDRH